MPLSDEQIIERFKSGDYTVFEELVQKYETKVYTVAYRFMGNHADACDLAQEAFIKIYQALHRFRGDSSLMTWIYHITANVCRDELRRRQRKQTISLDEGYNDNEQMSPILHIASDAPGPEELMESHELRDQVQQCLNMLSDEHRLILVMREIQGMSYDEIAQSLDCSLGTVKSRLNRARTAFKEKMKLALEHSSSQHRQTIRRGML